jgi:hypothetical protein
MFDRREAPRYYSPIQPGACNEGTPMLETHEGSCHCGRVRFRIRADLDAIGAIGECNCSICAKKGILHLTVPPDRFELLSGKEELTTYRFNTGTAQHTFCRHCGIHAFYVPRSDPDKISVNARCLDDVDVAALKPSRFFDGRHWEAAFAARQASERA